MVTQGDKAYYSRITWNLRIINAPALVLLGYAILLVVNRIAYHSPIQAVLGVVLALFGSGYSTITVLFPRPNELDAVERLALSGALTLAIGGLIGFSLANSPWGLNLYPFLAITGLFNLTCYLITWYRRKKYPDKVMIKQLDFHKVFTWQKLGRKIFSRTINGFLLLGFLSGLVVFTRNLYSPAVDPPMTEFYILGDGGQTQEYPKIGYPGETLDIKYGIGNRENITMTYQVIVSIQGDQVGAAQPVILQPGMTETGQINFHLPDTSLSKTKVDFILYRQKEPYRLLHLWIDMVIP